MTKDYVPFRNRTTQALKALQKEKIQISDEIRALGDEATPQQREQNQRLHMQIRNIGAELMSRAGHFTRIGG
tara:strand:- start:141 stop:356 length:216 start_codon:yes stop_codon:yes gene_type:complete